MDKEKFWAECDRKFKEASNEYDNKHYKLARDKDYNEYLQRSGERTLVKF